VTFNVWFRNQELLRVASFLERSGADTVILLELERTRALQLQALLPSYRFAHIDTAAHGAVLFSRWPLIEPQFIALSAQGARVASAQLNWRGRIITVVGAHLHWPIGPRDAALRRAELRGLATVMRAQPGPVLLGGDFNVTPWSRYFARFVADSGLVDCARDQGWRPTWPARPVVLRIRIDHCFASADWRTEQVTVGPPLGSDHLPNVLDLRLEAAR
jgi:endonuclease/exonuclease/phosphatase (EEP) superfamily protein YafD